MLGDAWASADGYLSESVLKRRNSGEQDVLLMFQMPKWGLVIAGSFLPSALSAWGGMCFSIC